MKVLDPGHAYKLNWLDGYPEVAGLGSRPHSSMSEDVLIFVKREGNKYPGNIGHYPGTNIQEVLRSLIDRVKYLNNQLFDERNIDILNYLRQCLYLLEERAAERHNRPIFLLIGNIEEMKTCSVCGHIGCNGVCHDRANSRT